MCMVCTDDEVLKCLSCFLFTDLLTYTPGPHYPNPLTLNSCKSPTVMEDKQTFTKSLYCFASTVVNSLKDE